MYRRGRSTDNISIERLWRSLKYKCLFLNALRPGSESQGGIGTLDRYCNANGRHATFDERTEVYAMQKNKEKLAAYQTRNPFWPFRQTDP